MQFLLLDLAINGTHKGVNPSHIARLMLLHYLAKMCLQCFDAVGWAAGRASGL